MSTIGAAWTSAVAALGGSSDAADELVGHYADPGRTYHGTAHVEAVLRHVAVLADEVGLDAATREVVVLAACAHDVVHDGRPDDETRSADWAVDRLTSAGLDADVIERVRRLVLATATHASFGDPAADVLCDADLAVLGGPPDGYAAYVRAVRAEYADVTDEQWRVGRAEVLTGLLALPQLFATPPGRARWEQAARANVLDELDELDELRTLDS